MFCNKCGAPLNDNVKFCTNCGAKVAAPHFSVPETSAPDTYIPKKNKSKAVPVIISVVLTVLVIAGIFAALIKAGVINFGGQKAPEYEPTPALTALPVYTEAPTSTPSPTPTPTCTFTPTPTPTDTPTPLPTESAAHIALNELSGIIAETEKSLDSFEISEFEGMAELIEIADRLYGELSLQKSKTEKLNGLPENIRKACSDMYELYLTGTFELIMDVDFLIDFSEIDDKFYDDEAEIEDLYDALVECFEEKVCPDNLKDCWSKMKRSLDYLGTYLVRSNEADLLYDALRQSSAENLLMRFATVYGNERDKLSEIINDELNFADLQFATGDEIMEDVKKVITMSDDAASSYKFRYDIENNIEDPQYDHIATIYPSLYNTYDCFVTIKMGCLTGAKDVIVSCEIPGLSQETKQSYHIGASLTVINIKPPASSEKLNLDKAKDTQIRVSIKEKSTGAVIDEQSFPVHIASRNDFVWINDDFGTITQDNILCFLSPDSEAITKLKRDAIDILSYFTNDNMDSLVGYQGPYFAYDYLGDGSYDDDDDLTATMLTTYCQVASLMRAMSDAGVRYTMDPFSIDDAGQHILFPDQVIERKTGLCIETSLVIASALQSAGMHTFLILPPGHAQVAVETWYGSGYYFLIETTSIPNTNTDFVDDANYFLNYWEGESDNYPISIYTDDYWSSYLEDCYVIDCSDGALLGMTPFAY